MRAEDKGADLMQLMWSGQKWGDAKKQQQQQQQQQQQHPQASHFLDLSSVQKLLLSHLSEGDVAAGLECVLVVAGGAGGGETNIRRRHHHHHHHHHHSYQHLSS